MVWLWACALAPRAAGEMGFDVGSASLVAGGVSSFAIAPMPHGAVLMMKVVASRYEMRRRATPSLMSVPNPYKFPGHSRGRDSPDTAPKCRGFMLQYQ